MTEAGELNQEGAWQEQGMAGAGLSAGVTEALAVFDLRHIALTVWPKCSILVSSDHTIFSHILINFHKCLNVDRPKQCLL